MLSSPTISPGSLGTGYRYQLSLSADGTFRADIDRLKEIAKKQENEKHQQQQEQKEKTNGFISESSGDNSDGNDSVQNNKNENQSDVNHQPPLSQQSGAMNTQEQDEFEDNQGPSRLSKVIQQIEQREASLKRTVLETNCLGGEYSDADGTGTGEDYYSDNSIVDDSEYHFLEEEKSSAENTGYYVARADKELPKDAIHSSENLSEDESPSNSLPVSSSVLPNTKNLPEDVQQSIARLKHKFEELVKKADGKEIRTLPKELDGALLDVAMVQDRHYPRGISTQVTEAISPIVGFQSSTLKSKMNLLKKVEKVRELQSQIESIEQQLKPIIEKEFRRYDQKIKQQEKQEQQEQEKQEKQPSLSSASSLSSSPPSSSSSSVSSSNSFSVAMLGDAGRKFLYELVRQSSLTNVRLSSGSSGYGSGITFEVAGESVSFAVLFGYAHKPAAKEQVLTYVRNQATDGFMFVFANENNIQDYGADIWWLTKYDAYSPLLIVGTREIYQKMNAQDLARKLGLESMNDRAWCVIMTPDKSEMSDMLWGYEWLVYNM
eukprot:gb/GECH01006694.1/.p1 GENE.gb/GECH01006694.1/~~gb/GECH01006694.1/.p1  ORF type:complete len:547 (+),score=188.95 gb/GECH01006694.1/:1-1641(+)